MHASASCVLTRNICRSILDATTEPPHKGTNQAIAQGVARDIDGRPTFGGDEDGIY